MLLDFKGSNSPTIGVEIELQLLDPETLDLCPRSVELLDRCNQLGLDRVKSEVHQSMVEIDTEISTDVSQCASFLAERLDGVVTLASELGLKIGLSGTHPFQNWPDRLISDGERYQALYQKFQWLTRRMNVYGMHVHVGVASGDRAVAISQAAIRYLPHLLALSANSPFWHGVDTGMQSSRVSVMESFPYSGVPPYLSNWDNFEHYAQTLYKAGAISSLKDLYWYIRPNCGFGTIEFRMCDVMSSLDETMAVVALIHSLVVWIQERLDAGDAGLAWSQEEHWIALENQWRAARDGLDASIILDTKGHQQNISASILELVQTLSPVAKRLNCAAELEYITKMIVSGNGAQKQRKVFQDTGSLKEVVTRYVDASNSILAF
jgi:carboxylate-amine ligase